MLIWSILTGQIISNFLKAIFHKFYLVDSGILCFICTYIFSSLVWDWEWVLFNSRVVGELGNSGEGIEVLGNFSTPGNYVKLRYFTRWELGGAGGGTKEEGTKTKYCSWRFHQLIFWVNFQLALLSLLWIFLDSTRGAFRALWNIFDKIFCFYLLIIFAKYLHHRYLTGS